MGPPAELPARELRVFFALAEDTHFGRVAERLLLTQPNVSRALAALERRVGGRLIDRPARRLTPLGESLLTAALPAYRALHAALEQARSRALDNGPLRLGATAGIDSALLMRLATAYERSGHALQLEEIAAGSPFQLLRNGELDAIVWPRSGNADDLTFGPTIATQTVLLAMRSGHPLSCQATVTLGDATAYGLIVPRFDGQPAGFIEDALPAHTALGASGSDDTAGMFHEASYRIARSNLLFPMASGVATAYSHRSDLAFRPLADQDPIELALIWVTDREDSRIRGLVDAARALGVSQSEPPRQTRASGGAGGEVGQHGKDAAVGVRVFAEVEFVEGVRGVFADRGF